MFCQLWTGVFFNKNLGVPIEPAHIHNNSSINIICWQVAFLGESTHEKEHKHVERDKVDDEHVAAPGRNLRTHKSYRVSLLIHITAGPKWGRDSRHPIADLCSITFYEITTNISVPKPI